MLPLLWGTVGMDRWPPNDGDASDIMGRFVTARAAFQAGRVADAIQLWRQIADAPDIEARHVLQAWTFLRANGVVPTPSLERVVFGVVVEVPVSGGRDVLAAYQDGSCRYLNHSGSVAVVDDVLQSDVHAVIELGQRLAERLGTWDQLTLPELPRRHARLTLLTPGGFRFGQGPNDDLLRDPNASPVFAESARLLGRLVELTQANPPHA
jgi:hypothetical protein